MTAKQFLARAYWLDRRIEKKTEEIERMRSRLERITAQITDMPRGGSGGDWTDLVAKVHEQEEAIRGEIAELVEVKKQIAAAIAAVEEPRYRTLLELRYRNYLSFERIAVEMNYSWRHVIRLHDEALRAVKVPEK